MERGDYFVGATSYFLADASCASVASFGGLPVARTAMILFRVSNQKGAPIETASAVNSKPIILLTQSIRARDSSRQPSFKPRFCSVTVFSLMISTGDWAAPAALAPCDCPPAP